MKWEKQITNWLHRYIDDVTDIEIDKDRVLLSVNDEIKYIISIQRLIREVRG